MSASSAKVRTITRIAMFAAILAVCSQIAIPLPSGVPVTLQTFAVGLVGYALGAKQGPVAVLVWCAIGLVGAPVFSNFMAAPPFCSEKPAVLSTAFCRWPCSAGLRPKKNFPAGFFFRRQGCFSVISAGYSSFLC